MYKSRDVIDEFIVETVFNDKGVVQGFDVIGKKQKEVLKNNDKLEKSHKRVATSGFRLGQALRTLGLYIGVKEVIKYADEWQRVANTLSQVTKTEKERVALQEKLYQIGRKTRTSTANTAELYTSLSAVGLSGQNQLNATETIQKAFKATGSDNRTVETIKRMLKTGKLSSLLGINQNLAEIIASGMGMSLEQLQIKIRKGGLTSLQVLTALSKKSKDIDKSFAKSKTTLTEAFDGLKDSATRFFGRLEESTGLFNKLAKVIGYFADNIETIALILGGVFLYKLEKSIGLLQLFFLNMKDGMGILGSAKGVFNALLAPWAKMLAIFELINTAIKMLKGEWNWFYDFIDKIERGTWWLMNKFTGKNKAFQGTFSSDVPIKKAVNPSMSSNTSSKVVNVNNNITVNESASGLMAVGTAIEASMKQATVGGF